jgi:TATA-box binding protein (TBP) (component of TFIID and TFIIIB)
MTGVKNIEQGNNTVNIVYNYIKSLSLNLKENILDNIYPLKKEIEIGMINSDFVCGFKINREILHRIVISMGYYSSFEPSIYPGVNIKYYYNPIDFGGICNCKSVCDGKGKNGNCKKITVAVFNSGSTIITGAKSADHLQKAYEFINKIINDKKEDIRQKQENIE